MRKILMPLFAVILGLCFCAFSRPPKKQMIGYYWYNVDYSYYPGGAIDSDAPDYRGFRSEVDDEVPCYQGLRPCVLGFDAIPTFPVEGPLLDFSESVDSFDETP